MTTTRYTKTIVAAIVTGALAMAAPAGASVADNPSGSQLQTVNATLQQPSDQGGGTSQFTALRRDGSKAEPFVANVGGTSQFTALRRDGSKAEPFVASLAGTPVAHSGDGFDVGDAALGGLLVAAAMLLGSGAIRKATSSKPGGAVSQGA